MRGWWKLKEDNTISHSLETSFWKVLWNCRKTDQIIHKPIVLCISCYEPPTFLLPSLAKSIPSYSVFVLVHRPRLRGHHTSRSLTTSCGGKWRAWSTSKNRMQRLLAANLESDDCIQENNNVIKMTIFFETHAVVNTEQRKTFWALISNVIEKWCCLLKAYFFF